MARKKKVSRSSATKKASSRRAKKSAPKRSTSAKSSAKSATAKSGKAAKAAKGRGGRKPGKWELTTPEEIREYRRAHGLSRAKLAAKLKVSTTSIQNWESGRVASRKIQERLRALMDGEPAPIMPSSPAAAAARGAVSGSAMSATAEIVASYVRTQKNLKPDELIELVRKVRHALD